MLRTKQKYRVAVLQSNYIPWKGYFDIIHDVDLFIFYDEVQYTKNDWRNRNKIMVGGAAHWLTVPAGSKIHQRIVDVEILDHHWQRKHFNALCMNYGRAPYFRQYEGFFRDVYLKKEWRYLYQLNRYLIEHIAHDFLGIKTQFADSRDFETQGTKHEKLLSLVKDAGAGVYISGPAAQDYIIAADYEKAGIELRWKDYGGYPEYPQQSEHFEHGVSIVDLLFQMGNQAPKYIWGWRK